ncbi:tetratricopeptide repeat protein [Chitinophaga skermanii]|uniref:Tetratricopeptide repeat protein n=1 Tax=Chitinophaga skermanii TaxID=331697 RepID=A0A327R9F4_9BACT|nr:tetratricopeptide repeat protein [Chitinophaga skermanii]RAJ10547.1 tetratricopeptide repeat protein [Chitinophaga skermanii]
MKALNFFIRYRLPIGVLLLVGGLALTFTVGFWEAFTLFLLAVVCFVTHFMFGPMRLVQEAAEAGDIDGAMKLMNQVKFPKLLYKPIRSVYYFLQSNFAMQTNDFDKAEANIRQSLKAGSPMKEMEGMQYFQLGMIAAQKGDLKNASDNLKRALKIGLPDKENKAAALFALCNISASKRDFKSAKEYLRRAKECKPTTPQIVNEIRNMDKNLSRMPG